MGAFVVVDGPNGVGKTTAVKQAVELLTSRGQRVHATKEPTPGPLGRFVKDLDGRMASETAYACLIAADRWEHTAQIQNLLGQHDAVLCDRYLPSSLVLNVARGVPASFILALHQGILRPNLTILLTADETEIRKRFQNRGLSETAGERLTTRLDEARRYNELPNVLRSIGHETQLLDTTHLAPQDVASQIVDAIKRLRS